MQIDKKMVEYVAELAKLRLNDEEKELMAQDLSKVLMYMDVLNTLDTENVAPVTHVFGVENVFREDVVQPSFNRDEILKNGIDVADGCFKVPKTVE
ncbi:MAG: Asp-tRNA(Asn)/Glu-tRNA(Gln) amidotransferase subunit GatC [Bacillota bacterium]|jgi:aspartyl-tRNA(Asn)/glutamyl-tRNA(Gln) amidotransferase subunit C